MAEQTFFKAQVKQVVIEESQKYKEVFVDYRYLICSKAFRKKDYYILATEFFDKCYNGTLTDDDFDFKKNGKDENSIKGSVRRKIEALERISTLFDNDILTLFC